MTVSVVNAWAGTFAQPAAFQTTPPALQSTVITLNLASSVGGGSGTPTAGNWLVVLAGWNQAGLAAATVESHDDIHSYWRPGKVSTSSAKTRCSAWYTSNLIRVAADTYIAPNGAVAGMACLVLELSGTGPWDVITGVSANYAAGATSLNLSLPAPSATSFVIAAVCGDSSAAGQAFAPGGWTALSTVTASNGSDHTCDAVLTSAILPSTSGSVSVSASATSATDLSGVIIGFQVSAPSPVPGGANPAWAGRMILEAAFGSGFSTPADQMTWTTLSDSGAPIGTVKRFWAWRDTSGVPYALGQLQSSTGTVELDNFDGALSPANSSSPYYPNVVTGVPVRLRMALGTIAGTTYNRWYVWQRNALKWPEKRNKIFRNFVPLSLTDGWSVASGACPTPYRGEILQDSPYAWWAMDDQPLSGGVQPTTLRSSAPGNTNTLAITAASGGVASADAYSTTGVDLTATGTSSTTPPFPSVATYAVAQQAGWMPGDPQASPASYATSNPVTASPGSAAWQQSGLLGDSGTQGWFLICNDASFPVLANGVTIKGWFNAGFLGSATGYTAPSLSRYDVAAQPVAPVTLCTLSTNTAPVAELQLDSSGHLNLITFSGTTPTSNTVYSSSDLRNGSWVSVDVQLTTTTWSVMVDGGLTASVSGTATGMTSAWTWLTLNGDYGTTSGGGSPANLQHGGNVAYSQWAVFSSQLPAWRLRAHYAAAITAFGLLPAPQTVSLSKTANKLAGTGYTPDGSAFQGSYGIPAPNTVGAYTFSALAVAQAGSYTSGPSARAVSAGYGTDSGGTFFGDAVSVSWTAVAPSVAVYTASSASGETNAATVKGSGDSFTSGYGSGATGVGVCQTAAGTGASPPSSPSSLGDSAGQRLERIFGYGGMTSPNRAVDPAPLLVQAASDVGGQQAGASAQNIVSSDNGLLYVDNGNTVRYRQKSHLASDTTAWFTGMNTGAGQIPWANDITYGNDPQRVYNSIRITPWSPDGASLPLIGPSSASAVTASQQQYGVRPFPVTSYLQDQAKMLAQANWLIAQFGQLNRRVETLTINAAETPAAWGMVAGLDISDLVQVYDAPFSAPATTGTYRVSNISRSVSFGANGSSIEAKLTLTLDPVPSSYWS